jgi:predicted TIM-barrel fold metal-dependent hydrolase
MSIMSESHTIDVHAHFLPPVYQSALQDAGLKSLDGGMPIPPWSPERALAMMDEVGITGAVLSVSSPHVNFVNEKTRTSLCRAVNDYAADVRHRHPDRFGAYAILPLPDMVASLAEFEHAIDQLQLDGVALPTHTDGYYLGDGRLAPLLAALDARRVTVFVHPTSPCCFESFGLGLPAPMIEFPFDTTRTAVSLMYSGALARHPNINFILPHAGGTLPFLAPRIAAIGAIPVLGDRALAAPDAVAALARFYYDTALSVAPQQIAALRTLAPVSQMLYGTDFPFATEARVRAAEDAFAGLAFTAQEEQMIRYGNASRLFAAFAQRCSN